MPRPRTTAIGKQLSERHPGQGEVERWADATADMLTTYLERLGPRPRRAA